jgi:hypothetical protein
VVEALSYLSQKAVAGKSNQMLLCNDDFAEAKVLFGAVLEIPDAHE